MGFKILDASAFYAGIPFGSTETYHTTSMVYDEVSHIKSRYDTIGMLVDVGRLVIVDPGRDSLDRARRMATETGDIASLSVQDISIIALCVELKGELVTDDYAVSNVAANYDIKCSGVMTDGIRTVGRWIHYCARCSISFDPGPECPRCGGPARRRLAERKPATGPLDK